jgi:hypothetical protein
LINKIGSKNAALERDKVVLEQEARLNVAATQSIQNTLNIYKKVKYAGGKMSETVDKNINRPFFVP